MVALLRPLRLAAIPALPALALSIAASAQETQTGFNGSFAPFAIVPAFPDAEGNAVDIKTITPPIEKPKPKVLAEPKARGVVRSLGTGVASYYGKRFHGRRTANGERFNMNAMTAAHKTLRFGTKVRVTNPRNGKSVVVRINDRGPFIRGRTIDLSKAAARRIGIISRGHGRVKLDIVR